MAREIISKILKYCSDGYFVDLSGTLKLTLFFLEGGGVKQNNVDAYIDLHNI